MRHRSVTPHPAERVNHIAMRPSKRMAAFRALPTILAVDGRFGAMAMEQAAEALQVYNAKRDVSVTIRTSRRGWVADPWMSATG